MQEARPSWRPLRDRKPDMPDLANMSHQSPDLSYLGQNSALMSSRGAASRSGETPHHLVSPSSALMGGGPGGGMAGASSLSHHLGSTSMITGSEEEAAEMTTQEASMSRRPLAVSQKSKRQMLCRHAFNPNGCTLGSLCPYKHATTNDPQQRATSEEQEQGDEAMPTTADLLGAKQDGGADTYEFEGASIFRWFWRENTFRYTENPNQWRPFSEEWEQTLETMYKDRGGTGTHTVRVAHKVDFDLMSICNTRDGGARRALQRIKINLVPRWFLVNKEKAVMCSKKLSERVEFEFITGRSSIFSVAAGGRPLLINLLTMLVKDPSENIIMKLSRQPVSLHHAGAAASPYNVPILDQRATFISAPQGSSLFCVTDDVAHLKHRELNPVVEPGYLEVLDVDNAPTTFCDKNGRCFQLGSASHCWALKHQCPAGRMASCSLCKELLEAQQREKTPSSPFGGKEGSFTSSSPTNTNAASNTVVWEKGPQAPVHLLAAHNQRIAVHQALFSHDGDAPPMPTQITSWRGRQGLSKLYRRHWEPPLPIQRNDFYTMHNVHVGSTEGDAVLQWFKDTSGSYSWFLDKFPQIQRIQHQPFLDRYLRVRNELQLDLWKRDEQLALNSAEQIVFCKLTRSCTFELLDEGMEFVTFFKSAVDVATLETDFLTPAKGRSQHRGERETSAPNSDDDDGEDPTILVACVAYFPTVFEELPDEVQYPQQPSDSSLASSPSGALRSPPASLAGSSLKRAESMRRPSVFVDDKLQHRVVPPMIPNSLTQGRDGQAASCAFFSATQQAQMDGCVVSVYDSCQWCPLYIISCGASNETTEDRVSYAQVK